MESVAQNLQLRCSSAGCASAAFCINAVGACGQPGDCQSTRMSPGHSPHLLLSNPVFWFCFFFPTENCMMVCTGKQESTFDIQESRGIVVIFPFDFSAFLNRRASLPSFSFSLNTCRTGKKGQRHRIKEVLPGQRCVVLFKIPLNWCKLLDDRLDPSVPFA